jgi:hypothetical protein
VTHDCYERNITRFLDDGRMVSIKVVGGDDQAVGDMADRLARVLEDALEADQETA